MTVDDTARTRGAALAAPSPVQRWIVGNGLPGVTPPMGLAIDDVRAEIGWAASNRLTGLLHQSARGLGERVPDDIGEALIAGLRQGLAVEAEACRVVRELVGAGFDPIVFKGLASAHLDYADPGNRTFYDVDLLVERSTFGAAAGRLADAGWTRIESPLGQRWEERYGRAAQFLASSGVEIDLHAALAAGYFGSRLDHDVLRRSTETFEAGGVQMTSFDADARLLLSCFALVLSRGGSARLVRDVAQQIIVTGASWERASRLAGEGDVVIAAAIQLVDEWVDLPPAATAWARGSGPTAPSASWKQRIGMRLADDGHERGWRSDVAGELLGLGTLDRVRYASGVAASRLPFTLRSASLRVGRRITRRTGRG